MSKRKLIAMWLLLLTAGTLLILSRTQPLWAMHMEAPQYQDEEALNIAIYPNAMRGDLEELHTLNQYIGVHLPEELPQFRWLPGALLAAALLPLAGLLGRGRFRTAVLFAAPVLLTVALCGAALQAKKQMHDIGHDRDQKAVMIGVDDFTPPFLGTEKIAQFYITSHFRLGTGFIALAVTLQLAAAALSRPARLPGVPSGGEIHFITPEPEEAAA